MSDPSLRVRGPGAVRRGRSGVRRPPAANGAVMSASSYDWAAVVAAPFWLLWSPFLVPALAVCFALIAYEAFVERFDDAL